MNNLEELNDLEQQIKETQNLLNETVENKEKLKKSKQWNVILGLLTILFLACSIWLYLTKQKPPNKLSAKNERIENDSIYFYKNYYLTNFKVADSTATTSSFTSLKDKKVIYSVQVGAFQNFVINSETLLNLKEFKSDGYNKISIGNFETYKEAKKLKDSLQKLGFKDCFLIAKSYGDNITIKNALTLSNEPEYLDQ